MIAIVSTSVDTKEALKMHIQSNIQKWGNSSAIRLPAKVLAASGIMPNSKVDIQASKGRLVIQLHETTNEQAFDKLFAEMPEASELISFVQQRLSETILLTDETTRAVEAAREKLSGNK
jgi:antitoxin component of MazEF toxin-antitoxin module